jgi:uncharacterized protein involved in exopolysaccharide biosynthesis
MPELPEGSEGKSSLGGLAGIAGIKLPDGSSSDIIRPELFPNIIQSTEFLSSIIKQKFNTEDKQVLLQDYLNHNLKLSLIESFSSGFKQSENTRSQVDTTDGVYSLTIAERKAINILSERITVNYNDVLGLIEIEVLLQDPVLSAKVLKKMNDNLTDYLADYKTKKNKRKLAFLEEQINKQRVNLENAQKELTSYLDIRQAISKKSAMVDYDVLQSNKSANYSIYSTLLNEKAETEIKINEDLPYIKIIEPIIIPNAPSEPNKLFILVLFTVFGVLVSLALVFFKLFRSFILEHF